MNNENVEDDKAKLMQMLDDEPPYDRERFEERRKATEVQWLEMVTMKDDMSLSIVTAQYFVGITRQCCQLKNALQMGLLPGALLLWRAWCLA